MYFTVVHDVLAEDSATSSKPEGDRITSSWTFCPSVSRIWYSTTWKKKITFWYRYCTILYCTAVGYHVLYRYRTVPVPLQYRWCWPSSSYSVIFPPFLYPLFIRFGSTVGVLCGNTCYGRQLKVHVVYLSTYNFYIRYFFK